MLKKLFLSMIFVLFITGCGSTNTNYKGNVTDISKNFLSKGYSINVYRSIDKLGDDAENYGKGYITMKFELLHEYYSISSWTVEDTNKVVKKVISNIKLVKTPKKGNVDSIYILEGYNQNKYEIMGTNNKYSIEASKSEMALEYTNLSVELNQIALYDIYTSPSAANGNQPTLSQIYNELGITRNEVSLILGFRVELHLESGKIVYKDYEVEMPPTIMDISGSEYHFDFKLNDINQMEPFLEKQ